MLKTGIIGFGGGTSLIPVIEHEIVVSSGMITEEEYNKNVMIASITPGALPVEIAAGIGQDMDSVRGSIASAFAMAFPGAALTLLFLVLFSGMEDDLRAQIRFIAAGISVFIILVLTKYVVETVAQAHSRHEKFIFLSVLLSVFALSGEKNIYALLGLSITPVFSISTPRILAAAFFVILFTEGQLRRLQRTVLSFILVICYFLCSGRAHLLPAALEPYLLGLMAVLATMGLMQSVSKANYKKRLPLGQALKTLLGWLFFVLLLSIPAILITGKTLLLLGTGFLSSIMSFGGGDAYLSIAQGLFVENDIVSHAEFYGNIVTVANALPGSVLCKVLTGIGYTVGYELNHSVTEGLLIAVSCFACSIASSGIIYTFVWAIYEKYENLQVFDLLKRFIRPIISGLLLNVAISLYLSGIRPLHGNGRPSGITIFITAILLAGNLRLLFRKQTLK